MTTTHSRADALTIPRDLLNDLIDDVQSFADQVPCREREKAFRADLLARARALAGSPSLQPAAAPIETCPVCHAKPGQWQCPKSTNDLYNAPPDAACRAAPAPSPADEPKYTQADMERYGKAYADARDMRRAAPSPANERAAISELLGHISDVLPDSEFEKIDTTKWNAVSAIVGAARAASANETGAEGFTYATKQATACAGCGDHKHTPLRIDWMGGYVCLTCIDRELESRSPTMAAEAVAEGAKPVAWLTEDRMSEIARKCEIECNAIPGTNMWQCAHMAIEETLRALAEPHLSTWVAEVCEDADGYKHIEAVIEDLDDLPKGMKLYGAPQPAQADARVGLTADMRVAIQECIDYLKPAAKDFADLNMGDSKHARCIRTLRALLQGANQ